MEGKNSPSLAPSPARNNTLWNRWQFESEMPPFLEDLPAHRFSQNVSNRSSPKGSCPDRSRRSQREKIKEITKEVSHALRFVVPHFAGDDFDGSAS